MIGNLLASWSRLPQLYFLHLGTVIASALGFFILYELLTLYEFFPTLVDPWLWGHRDYLGGFAFPVSDPLVDLMCILLRASAFLCIFYNLLSILRWRFQRAFWRDFVAVAVLLGSGLLTVIAHRVGPGRHMAHVLTAGIIATVATGVYFGIASVAVASRMFLELFLRGLNRFASSRQHREHEGTEQEGTSRERA
jgi:hypothetical protein